MEVLFVLIPVSIALAAASVAACLAAIRGGQYDDLESPRWRILFDDRRVGRDGCDDRRAGRDGCDDRRAKDAGGAMMNVDEEPTGAQARRSNPL